MPPGEGALALILWGVTCGEGGGKAIIGGTGRKHSGQKQQTPDHSAPTLPGVHHQFGAIMPMHLHLHQVPTPASVTGGRHGRRSTAR